MHRPDSSQDPPANDRDSAGAATATTWAGSNGARTHHGRPSAYNARRSSVSRNSAIMLMMPNNHHQQHQHQQQDGEDHQAALLDAQKAASELLAGTSMRSRTSFTGALRRMSNGHSTPRRSGGSTPTGAIPPDESLKIDELAQLLDQEDGASFYGSADKEPSPEDGKSPPEISKFEQILNQTTAVAVVCLLNMMISIPFGSSYFPVGWKPDGDASAPDDPSIDEDDDVHGSFPIAAKQALGIRMFLFATFMGQFAFTFSSKFTNPVGLQMVENVPFLHAICSTVIRQQGYGKDALSTVFFLFGLSSVVVGLTFYLLGKWKLGRIVYFFPNHVLVGCIGGIGVFIVITAIEVTNDETFSFDWDGLVEFGENFHLFAVVLFFELLLRVLMHKTQDSEGVAKYPYLSPAYFCCITPAFYLGLYLFGISKERASEIGYFFPATADAGATAGATESWWRDESLWDIFRIVDFSTISWTAVFQSTGTVVALAAFSLIHVPINIPAFAISTDVEVDMNAELMSHGYANFASGIFGGLQNYVTYSNSVLYAKSGGDGKISSFAIVGLTMVLFVIGPEIAAYLPRCMAGTLLFHIGIDLILEGVYDSYGNYDYLEYTGIWVIALVMTIWGMTAALIAGVIAALSTYAVQSINHQNPIRQILSATHLHSSHWNRCLAARSILEDDATGRSRILIFQLQGHIFFGNIALLTDTIKEILKAKESMGELPLVVILDFTLVVGLDSSAAHAVAKLKKIIPRLFGVEVSIFVTGSGRGGFPCEYALTEALCPEAAEQIQGAGSSDSGEDTPPPGGDDETPDRPRPKSKRGSTASKPLSKRTYGQVCESLDEALRVAEDFLIALEKPNLVQCDTGTSSCNDNFGSANMSRQEEEYLAKKYLRRLFSAPDDLNTDTIETSVELLMSFMERREYSQDQALWKQGEDSDSAQLLVVGELLSIIEDTGASEQVRFGEFVGELGLVHEPKRLTTLMCSSEKAVLYALSRKNWNVITAQHPHLARMLDAIVIRYLAHRVQHVSNRYFQTTLPV